MTARLRKKKVLFIVPSLARAGAESQLVSLANGLDPTLFEKHVLWFERRDDLASQIDDSVIQIRLRRKERLDLSLVRQISAVIEERNIDVVHSTLLIALFYAWFGRLLSRRKPPLVAAIHTTRNWDWRSEMFDRVLYRWLLMSCNAVVFVCDAQRQYWVKRFPFLERTAHRVYNGIDIERFKVVLDQKARRVCREKLGFADSSTVALCVAAMRPEKGHAILLDAMSLLRERCPGLRLLLAGDGVLRPDIERRIAALGLEDRVYCLGLVPDVRDVLPLADFSVLPSTSETFSMAMLESMAMGVPPLATDVGGAAEAVQPGLTGSLVEPGDPEALAAAMLALSRDPANCRKMGERGRELVRERFTREKMIEETGRLLFGTQGPQER